MKKIKKQIFIKKIERKKRKENRRRDRKRKLMDTVYIWYIYLVCETSVSKIARHSIVFLNVFSPRRFFSFSATEKCLQNTSKEFLNRKKNEKTNKITKTQKENETKKLKTLYNSIGFLQRQSEIFIFYLLDSLYFARSKSQVIFKG